MPRLAYIALILLSLIWGGSFYFMKILLNDFGPWTISFLRSGCGLIVVTAVMLAFRKPFGFRTIPWLSVIVMASINTAIPWTLIAYSETHLSSSLASILNAATPVWTIVVGIALFRHKSTRNQWIGVGVATIGLLVLLGIKPGSFISVDPVGLVCMIGATICYAIGSQLSKKLLTGYSMYQISFGTLLTSMVGSGSFAFATESIDAADLVSASNLPMIIGLGAFGSGFAYILFYYMVQKGSAEFASMVTYLVPGTALIWGFTLLDEEIKWNMLLGLFIILGGVFLAGRKSRKMAG
ncbi:DMT family transporter [Cohnella lupini]|uniref:Drug/metabolite transporter (DMT)-like permease n=1 Tax=Cohnella lupini TaxID=1294267 RepID=A0A3D9I8R7_9BACL|nr:DMT family transporter [Cohnella lupini]RED58091.1 drug/metabolite transporter (DMT)-like permease [Cohnella lupini]